MPCGEKVPGTGGASLVHNKARTGAFCTLTGRASHHFCSHLIGSDKITRRV